MVLSCETVSTYTQYFFITAGVNVYNSYLSGAYYSHWSFNMFNKNRWATLHKMALTPCLVGLLFHSHSCYTNYSVENCIKRFTQIVQCAAAVSSTTICHLVSECSTIFFPVPAGSILYRRMLQFNVCSVVSSRGPHCMLCIDSNVLLPLNRAMFSLSV